MKAKWDALKVNLPESSQERFEVHHIIPKYVLERLGLGDHINSVPCILLEKADHNKGRLTRPKSFHSILIDLIPENDGPFNDTFPNGLSRQDAKDLLGRAYGEWVRRNDLLDTDADHAQNFQAIIDGFIDPLP